MLEISFAIEFWPFLAGIAAGLSVAGVIAMMSQL